MRNPMTPFLNEFSISVATVNGSGSQSANLILLRSLFNMGLPVGGKNLFPSNIAGLPTWFNLRVSERGFVGASDHHQIAVLMNGQTWEEDVASLPSDGLALFNSDLGIPFDGDFISVGIPCTTLARAINPKLARLLTNTVYVGALAQLLGIEQDALQGALNHQFSGKEKVIDINLQAVASGRQYIQSLGLDSPFRVERRDLVGEKILTDGNTAAALGSIWGGVSLLAWYPITPSSSIPEQIKHYLPLLRRKEGKATYAVVQAEDELAAIGIILGGGWAGVRSLTATSGPGISLMAEFAGYGYYAEIPTVIWDVQRAGPSTGLPTRTQQGDLTFVHHLGHGDTCHPILLPGTVEECFEFGWKAFDFAERFQTPLFVLSDLDLGMNPWMTEPFPYPDLPMDRGKVLSEDDLDAIEDWGRYKDVDGDGIPYRTLPGTPHPLAPYFTRGSGHNAYAKYTENPDAYRENMDRLLRKIEGCRTALPQPIVVQEKEASFALLYCGSTETVIGEMISSFKEKGVFLSTLRVRALPLSPLVREFVESHDSVFVIDQNRDAQLYSLVRSDLPPSLVGRLHSLPLGQGLPLTAQQIARALEKDMEARNG